MVKKEMIAMLLAGGQGSRLGVLTRKVAKPAVSFGGKYRIMLYSSSVRPITGNSGSIVDITLSVGADAQEGGHTIRLTDIVFSSTTAEKTIGADVTATITISSVQPGDADGDGVIDVNDITNVAAHILGNNPANFNAAAADADGDGVIDVNDITVISRIILNGGQ